MKINKDDEIEITGYRTADGKLLPMRHDDKNKSQSRFVFDGEKLASIPSESETFYNQLFSPQGLKKLFGLAI